MENNQKPRKLGRISMYLLKSFKFFDMKEETLTPVIFTVMLIVIFASTFLPDITKIENLKYIPLNLLLSVISNFFAIVYMAAYIKDLRNKEYNLWNCFGGVLRKLPAIIASSLLFALAVTLGFVALFVPGVIIALMFAFNICYIVDQNQKGVGSLAASKSLTDGYKRGIFVVFLTFALAALSLLVFISAFILSSNGLIQAFVISFLYTIISIAQVRLTALMYMDLEYGLPDEEQKEELE